MRLRGDRRSRSTRRCSAGARATSTSPTCRSCAARGSRSTRATRCSGGSSPRSPTAGKDEQPKPTPSALRTLVQLMRAYPERFVPSLRPARARGGAAFTRIYSRPSLTWEDLPFLRERTKLPILLKGILHPDDARARSTRGSTASSSPTTAAARSTARSRRSTRCRAIAAAVDGRIPVMLDSGVRAAPTRSRRSRSARPRSDRAPVRLRAGDRRRGRRARGAPELQGRLRPHARAGRLPLGRRDRPGEPGSAAESVPA